jgi:hypothetical protein
MGLLLRTIGHCLTPNSPLGALPAGLVTCAFGFVAMLIVMPPLLRALDWLMKPVV